MTHPLLRRRVARPGRLVVQNTDTLHTYFQLKMVAGQRFDLGAFKSTPELRHHLGLDDTASDDAPSRAWITSGVAIIQLDHTAMVGVPESGELRFGCTGLGVDYIEAVTDCTYICFTAGSQLETHQMYKLETYRISQPESYSDLNGLYLCMISGTADIGGQEFTTGMRFDLTAAPSIVTPVGGDAQFVIVQDRNAPPAPEFPTVPRSVSPRQIRQALTQAGLRGQVEAAVASGSQDTKDWWEFATLVERNNPQVVGMGAALGVTVEQMDDIFMLAATL